MTIRTTPNPVVRWAGRRLKQLNDRHPWSHNHHFHPWILRSLPEITGRVLDVGCGRGDLVAKMARHAVRVDGVDADRAMARASASRFREDPRLYIWRRTFAEHAARTDLRGAYDAITMVASLHHMDLDEALTGVRKLLRPGGRLLVVTLVQPTSVFDHLWDVTNALINPLIGFIKHPRPVREPSIEESIPVREPAWPFSVLLERAELILPGAVIRHREGFRVTLRWQKPGTPITPIGQEV